MIGLPNPTRITVRERLLSRADLVRDWDFVSSRPWVGASAHRIRARVFGRRAAPDWHILKPVRTYPRWVLYFAYLPDGTVTAAHRFTLERLAALDAAVLLVAALPTGATLASDIAQLADALIVKDLGGYDFSAYALGLREIATASAGADVFVMNDSVFGPFADLDEELAGAPWDFTGYTAFSMIENHIQSYAFVIKRVDCRRLNALQSVLSCRYAYDRYNDVIFQQETRLARIANGAMSVGAHWFGDHRVSGDPSFFAAIPLLEVGFPFLKKSLMHRRPDIYQPDTVIQLLREQGHPAP